ncbi:MAG: hypothetical protein L6264_05460 [Weeksellaceae bacterium]|nr:hypothetical protein [Bacteroidota bacterium]MCG2780377.1 hypothetical protein [Weeksellaceae bacterium]
MKQQREKKVSIEDLEVLTKTGLTVIKLPHSEGVHKETAHYRISKVDSTGDEEFSETFSETELLDMLKILKII